MSEQTDPYELYYWPSLQGRGEPIRLAFEDAGVPYLDVGRRSRQEDGGVIAIQRLLRGEGGGMRPFAPPILKVGDFVLAQTAAILQWLGPRLGLVPDGERERAWIHQLQLTIADLFAEVHDVHHPIAVNLYYEDQQPEARRRAHHFITDRMPKFLGYFESVLKHNPAGKDYLVGDAASYADLSLFQTVAGLRYAFPRAMDALAHKIPLALALHDRIAARPRLAAYLASTRRIPFNEEGIFRHYDELDEPHAGV